MDASTEGVVSQPLTDMQNTEDRQADDIFAATIRSDRTDPVLLGWGIDITLV